MADILLPFTNRASLATVPASFADFFVDSVTGLLSYKNAAGGVFQVGGGPTQWVNAVNNIGLDNTGATDNAATLNAYLAANSGKTIYFPAGTYKFSTTITVANWFQFMGDGMNSTIFQTTSATADIFQMTSNWYNFFEGIVFTSSVTRTAGYALNFTTTDYCFVLQCQFTGMFNGINLGGNLSYINQCQFANTVNFGISVSGSINNSYISQCTMNGSPIAAACINVTQCGSLLIDNCDLIGAVAGLLVNPTSPNGAFSIQAVNTFFDTCTTGVSFTGTGNINRTLFTGCWFGDSTNGFASTSAALPAGTVFTGCIFAANSGTGLLATAMVDFQVEGCIFGGNTVAGITISAAAGAVTRFKIIGNNIGANGGLSGSTTGIMINSGTYGGYMIKGNDLSGNTTNLNDGGTTTGQNQKIIKDNIGHLIQGGISATIAASAAINTTETVIAGGLNNAVIPANSLRVGTKFRITLAGSCTATAAVLSTFTIRMGTAGTIADASVATGTCTGVTGTALFKVIIEFVVTSIGATGTILGNMSVLNGGVVGIATLSVTNVALTPTATLNTTTANYLSLTYKTAATTDTSTFSAPCDIEIVKT